MYIHVHAHLRQLIFLRKGDCLGCAVLLCSVVCLTLLACFLPFFSSHVHVVGRNTTCLYNVHVHVHVVGWHTTCIYMFM